MIKKILNNKVLILYFIPFVIGSLSTLSFQPFNLTILNFFILPIFFYLTVYIKKKSKSVYRKKPYKKNLFVFGLLFGLGFYLSGISWIANSLTFDENFKIFIPFAVILIPLFLSLFTALTILIIGPHLNFNIYSIFIFSGGLALTDFLRAKLFTGFPWNLWAYSTSWFNEIIQIVNIFGFHTYNLILITLYTIPAILFFNVSLMKKLINSFFLLLFIFLLYIYGNYVINKNEKITIEGSEKIFVKIISPDFDLKYGLSKKEIEDRFKKLIKYSEPSKNKKTVFIWPEGTFSGYSFDEISIFKELILENFSENHTIIFGVNILSKNSHQFYNGMIAINNQFEIIQSYYKRKLVPFGEFLPFENLLNTFGLKKITEGHGSFLRGTKNNNILIDQLNILPLICYEVIFTELIQNSSSDTNLIINISEDGWFGNTIGPHQHFAKSIFRAIENNTFLLRSTNKGISAIVDNKGNIIKQLNLNEAGNIELKIPLIKTNKIKNDLIFYILLITYLLSFLIYRNKHEKK